MLSKQSIRGTVKIIMDGKLIEGKESIINESSLWEEKEVDFFKKMLKQGGKFSLNGHKYSIIPNPDHRSLV
tara:strand:+ start:2414 stop:2626 length:213 start_codon:yes stop_codon:yes gene_type:complete